MSTLNDKKKQWLTNKLNGNFAENICAVHFQSFNEDRMVSFYGQKRSKNGNANTIFK